MTDVDDTTETRPALDLPAARRHYEQGYELAREPTKALFAFWSDVVARHGRFARQDFDPVKFPAAHLPYLMILDAEFVAKDVPRLRWRLVGTHVASNYDEPLQNAAVDALDTRAWKTFWNSSYALAIVDNRPVKGLVSLGWRERHFILAEYIFLPMHRASDTPDQLICAVEFFAADTLSGTSPLTEPAF